MAKSREINMNLPSADDLFTTQEERDQKNQEYVKNISIYEITDFPNHPFKVKMDDKMLETIESVRDHGVLVPALVREKPTGGYEMISGHRRKMASELAGKETMPCIVRNLTIRKSICLQDEVGRYEKTGKPHRFNFHAIGSEVEGKRIC